MMMVGEICLQTTLYKFERRKSTLLTLTNYLNAFFSLLLFIPDLLVKKSVLYKEHKF